MRVLITVWLLVLLQGAAIAGAQTFEVASIKANRSDSIRTNRTFNFTRYPKPAKFAKSMPTWFASRAEQVASLGGGWISI